MASLNKHWVYTQVRSDRGTKVSASILWPVIYKPDNTELMNIQFQNDRPGYTYIPDVVDEMTGERIEGTGTLAESHVVNLVKQDLNFDGQSPETYEELDPLTEEEQERIDADADYEGEELSPTELADISDELHSHSIVVDEAHAASIASVDMGDTPSNVVVQYLTHKVYQGELTPSEAFGEALDSGLPPKALAASFRKLQS